MMKTAGSRSSFRAAASARVLLRRAVPALLACLCALPACSSREAATHGGPAFSALSYEDARAAAASQGKLFLVDAMATWCGPCKTMDRDTWPDPEVQAWIGAHAVAVQVDVDAQPAIAQQLRIEAMPTLILFRGETELARSVGGMRPQVLLDWLKSSAP